MFKSITYSHRNYSEWTDRFEYYYSINDSDFVTDTMIIATNNIIAGSSRSAYVGAICKTYESRNLNIAKNVALFYAWFFQNHLTITQQKTWNVNKTIDIDVLYVEYLLPKIFFCKNNVNCIKNQMKLLQYCGKLPKYLK